MSPALLRRGHPLRHSGRIYSARTQPETWAWSLSCNLSGDAKSIHERRPRPDVLGTRGLECLEGRADGADNVGQVHAPLVSPASLQKCLSPPHETSATSVV